MKVSNIIIYAILYCISESLHQHQAVFKHRGLVHEILGFVHLKTTVPLGQLGSTCHNFQQWGKIVQERIQPAFMSSLPKQQLYSKIKELERTCQNIPIYHDLDKEKRSILTAILGTIFGILGLKDLLGLDQDQQQSNQHHLIQTVNQIRTELDLDKLNQEILDRRTKGLGRQLDLMELELQAQQDVDFFASKVDSFVQGTERIRQGIEQLHSQKLSPQLVDLQTVRNIWSSVTSFAFQLGGQPAVAFPDLIYQLPTSTLIDGRDLIIISHIPIVADHEGLQLFQLMSRALLLPTQPGQQAVVATIATEQQLLAVNPQGHSVQFSSDRLGECLRIGHAHFCEALILEKALDKSCLSRLFRNNLRDLHLHCPITLETVDHIFLPAVDNWIGFHKEHEQVRLVCRNGTIRNQQYQGNFQLPWVKGCSYETPQFHLAGVPQPPSELVGTVINLTPTLNELLGFNISAAEVHEAREHHRISHHLKIPLKEVLVQRHHIRELNLQEDQSFWHLGFTTIISIGMVSLVAVLILLSIIHRHQYKEDDQDK